VFLSYGGLVHARRITSAVLALIGAAAIAACDDDDDDPLGTGNENTTVRFFNATSGGLSLDIAEGGTVEAGNGNLAFGGASSCIRVDNDNHRLAVRTANSTTSLPGFSPAFAAGETYTVLVSGTATAPVFTTLNDEFTAPGAGNAAVRIINATSSATAGTGSYDIYVNPGASLGTPNATAVQRNAQSNYLTVPAGQSNILRLTNTGQTGTVLNITVPSLTAGTVTTIVVADAAAGTSTLRTFTLAPCT
jgi:hypothetical protein